MRTRAPPQVACVEASVGKPFVGSRPKRFEYVSRATKDEEMEVDEWVPNASQGLPKTLGARWVYLRGSSVRTCALAVLRLGGGRC